jgi:hypothetical protein
MKVIDSVQDKGLHKLTLVEDGGEYAVLSQAINRRAMSVQGHLNCDAAKALWRKVCLSHFYSVTRNLHDAEALAERRIATIH